MPPFLIALIVVVGGIWFIRKSSRMGPKAASQFMQKLAGGVLMGFSGLLLLRGQINVATALFAVGAGLFGKSTLFRNGFNWSSDRTPGQTSTVTTSLLSLALDHDSGRMEGVVVSGPLVGRALSSLSEAEMQSLYASCQSAADQSLSLLEAWLARERPQWGNADAGRNGQSKARGNATSRDEAYAVLGLRAGASEAEIKAAHKRLIKEFHPDKGGTDYLAAKINEAKDVLLGA